MTYEIQPKAAVPEAGTEVITKRKVTGYSAIVVGFDDDGNPMVSVHKSEDYVREDHLDAALVWFRANWQQVLVSEDPDAGPNGYHGQTLVPDYWQHTDAGKVFPHTYVEAGLEVPDTAKTDEEHAAAGTGPYATPGDTQPNADSGAEISDAPTDAPAATTPEEG